MKIIKTQDIGYINLRIWIFEVFLYNTHSYRLGGSISLSINSPSIYISIEIPTKIFGLEIGGI